MKTLLAIVLTLCLTATAHAAYVDVSYTVTGSPGDYLMNFTFANQQIRSVQGPGDWNYYHMGVSVPGASSVGHPIGYNPSAPVGEYTNVWTYQQAPNATSAYVALFPGTAIEGFLIHSAELQPPSIASWFMTGSAQWGNGYMGWHSGGRLNGQLRATMRGVANGTLLNMAPLVATPIPGAVVLFASGLAVLWWMRRRALVYSL